MDGSSELSVSVPGIERGGGRGNEGLGSGESRGLSGALGDTGGIEPRVVTAKSSLDRVYGIHQIDPPGRERLLYFHKSLMLRMRASVSTSGGKAVEYGEDGGRAEGRRVEEKGDLRE